MESAFVYDSPVTGRMNIGRKADADVLVQLLRQGRHVVLYDTPKSGKTSLVRQAFSNISASKESFMAIETTVLGSRNLRDLVLELGSQIIRSVAKSTQEIAEAVFRYFSGTSFEFAPDSYRTTGRLLDISREPDETDLASLFELPERIALDTGRNVYLVVDEFQDIEFTECRDMIMSSLRTALGRSSHVSFVLCGSMVNAMKDIFRPGFAPFEHLALSRIAEKDITNYVSKIFLSNGKVIEEDQIHSVCEALGCNIWYVNHFCAICDGLSKGYVVNPIVKASLDALISVHEPRFRAIMSDLTNFQLSFLKAVLEGCTKFSSTEVIESYRLNSSANVSRIKDALCKKEIITIDEESSSIEILDPLFKHWASAYYFKICR